MGVVTGGIIWRPVKYPFGGFCGSFNLITNTRLHLSSNANTMKTRPLTTAESIDIKQTPLNITELLGINRPYRTDLVRSFKITARPGPFGKACAAKRP